MLAAAAPEGRELDEHGRREGDVTSTSDYLGSSGSRCRRSRQPLLAAKVRTEITQAGAIGDPYGSGVRTVWWVYGVGPVKVVFEHAGGSDAPVATSVLASTNQTAKAPPPDAGTSRWSRARPRSTAGRTRST